MATRSATPANLASLLSAAQPGDVIQLATGNYAGTFDLKVPGVIIEPAPGASPRFTGPAAFTTSKVAWLHIWPSAKGATVRDLNFTRSGDIADMWRKGWNDYGIIVEAPDVRIEYCTLGGMAKGIHVKGKQTTGCTIIRNVIGPTIDSCIAVGTSYGVVRGMLIGWNLLKDSLREDAVQFMPNFDLSAEAEQTDVSNLGTILYENTVEGCNENAFDMKGAGQIIIHGGTIRHVAGYSNGYPFDPNKHYGPVIMHGARTSTGLVIVRNVDIQQCGGGIKVFPLWHIFHNLLEDNNFDPRSTDWAGNGISQPGSTPTAAVVNNLARDHKGADFAISQPWPDYRSNYMSEQEGEPLTWTASAGRGQIVKLKDAGYFTDWFGRKDLPPDVLYLNGVKCVVEAVDYAANTVRLDKIVSWQDGDPVFWRSPMSVAGIQPEYVPVEPPTSPPVEPLPPIDPTIPDEPETPPTDPPTQPVTVSISLTFDIAPGMAQGLREAVAAGTVRISFED